MFLFLIKKPKTAVHGPSHLAKARGMQRLVIGEGKSRSRKCQRTTTVDTLCRIHPGFVPRDGGVVPRVALQESSTKGEELLERGEVGTEGRKRLSELKLKLRRERQAGRLFLLV